MKIIYSIHGRKRNRYNTNSQSVLKMVSYLLIRDISPFGLFDLSLQVTPTTIATMSTSPAIANPMIA